MDPAKTRVLKLIADLQDYRTKVLQKIESKEEEVRVLLVDKLRRVAEDERERCIALAREHLGTCPHSRPSTTEEPSNCNPTLRLRPTQLDTRPITIKTLHIKKAHYCQDEVNTAATQPQATIPIATGNADSDSCTCVLHDAMDPLSLGAADSMTLVLTGEQRRFGQCNVGSIAEALSSASRKDVVVTSLAPKRADNDCSVEVSAILPARRSTDLSMDDALAIVPAGFIGDASHSLFYNVDCIPPPQRQQTKEIIEKKRVRFSSQSPQVAVFSVERFSDASAETLSTNSTHESADENKEIERVKAPLISPRASVQAYLASIKNMRESLQASSSSAHSSSSQTTTTNDRTSQGRLTVAGPLHASPMQRRSTSLLSLSHSSRTSGVEVSAEGEEAPAATPELAKSGHKRPREEGSCKGNASDDDNLTANDDDDDEEEEEEAASPVLHHTPSTVENKSTSSSALGVILPSSPIFLKRTHRRTSMVQNTTASTRTSQGYPVSVLVDLQDTLLSPQNDLHVKTASINTARPSYFLGSQIPTEEPYIHLKKAINKTSVQSSGTKRTKPYRSCVKKSLKPKALEPTKKTLARCASIHCKPFCTEAVGYGSSIVLACGPTVFFE